MQTISINFIVPEGWHELGDKQLRYVYQLLADGFGSDEIKTLCLLRWGGAKVVGKQDNGSYLLKKGTFRANEGRAELALAMPNAAENGAKHNILFEVTPITLAELLPALDWLATVPAQPVWLSKINRREAIAADLRYNADEWSE